MKYFSTMITKLVTDEFGLEADEREELKTEMQVSMEQSEQTNNKFVQKLNSFLKHPLGVLSSILGYAYIKRTISRITLETDALSMEEQFKLQYKQKLMEEMLSSDE